MKFKNGQKVRFERLEGVVVVTPRSPTDVIGLYGVKFYAVSDVQYFEPDGRPNMMAAGHAESRLEAVE